MIDKGLYKDQRLTEKEKNKIKPVKQGGGMNYLGKQETVTVPKKWLSDPDHVVAELAYITPREQKILLDANIYGSLKGKPNTGPGGIMSLQGDLGGYDASPGGPNDRGNRVGDTDKNKQRASDIMTGKVNVTSPTGITEGYRGPDPTGRTGPDGLGDFVYEPSAFQKAVDFYNKLPTPLNLAKKFASKFGPINNLDFYNEKVVPAGKTNLNYDDYMSARMAGKIDAYGNEINNRGGGDGARNNLGIMEVSNVTPIAEDENEETAKNYDFNYGTASNPIFYSDLV